MKHISYFFKTLRYSIKFLWKTDRIFLLIKLLNIIPNVINSVILVTFPGYIIDSLSKTNDLKLAITYTVFFVLTTIMHSIITGLISKELSIRKIKLQHILSKQLLKTTCSMDYQSFEATQTLDEFEYAKNCLSESNITGAIDSIFSIITCFINLFAYFYIILKYSWFFVPLAIITILVNAFVQNKKEQLYVKIQKESASLDRKITYASSNLIDYNFAKEIRLFNLKDFIFKKYNHFISQLYGLDYKYLKKILPFQIIATLIGAIQIFVCYGSIGYSLYINEITVGMFVQYSTAYFALSSSIISIISSSISLKTKWEYISSYDSFLKKTNLIFSSKKVEGTENKSFSTIEFKNVFFKYPSSENFVLKNINATFKSNEKIAIVGANGAGKTTLIKILLGLYKPTSGEILINGLNIYDMNFSDYISYFSAIFQDCSTLSYSIAENIALSEEYSTIKINEILTNLQLENKLSTLKNGINTSLTRTLDELGTDLSGGEKQKIIISRALYKDSPIYIFDEPTAALSANSEYEIYKSFSSITNNKTVFYISHRLASCKLCNRIIVLQDGKIEEDGNFESLIKKQGLFKEMFDAQAQYYKQ